MFDGFELATLIVIVTDCTCSCKSNYHTITTTPVNDDVRHPASFNLQITAILPHVVDR
jgi:hypothetical protein